MTRIVSALRGSAALLLVLSLAACGSDGWFGKPQDPPLPGKRISVLQLDRHVQADPRLAGTAVTLPPPAVNELWPEPGGYPDHAMGHLAVAASLHPAWHASIGDGSSDNAALLTMPVVAAGRVFALDTSYTVTAFDAATGKPAWHTDVAPKGHSSDALGGGVAFAEGRLFVTTSYGEVLALDAATGAIKWRHKVSAPVRAAPTISGGRVFVVTVDNQSFALSTADGSQLWSHTGILETASLLGSASVAADPTVAIVPYSSGELFALRVENGRVAWSDNLAAIRRIGELTGLADIRGMPVIDRGLIYAVSHSGRTVAIDQRSGARVWEQEIGGVSMPWVAGDYLFMLDNDDEVVALTRQGGQVRWVQPLARYTDPEDKSGPILWAGPILAGNRLWLTNSAGKLVALSPNDGHQVEQYKLPGRTLLAPIVANGTLYTLTDDGELSAYR